MHIAHIETPEGVFTAGFTDQGLARLEFPATRAKPPAKDERKALPPELSHWRGLTEEALRQALRGESPRKLPPLDLTSGTEFQQRVWSALQNIPTGKTRTYSQVAIAIRKPRAVRAVGSACGANPVAVLVPCHRVVAKDGGLGGFSSDLKWKHRLLSREGVMLDIAADL